MNVKVVAYSFAVFSASFAVHAAAPSSQDLSVDITAPTNGSRVPWQSQAPYAVTVNYDGKSTKFGEIPSSNVVVRASYVANADAASSLPDLPDALVQISRSNCTGCHDFAANSSAPSFTAIGKRYAGRAGAAAMLANHIRDGSHGSWGSGSMPPHPDMSADQAHAIAEWIVNQAADPSIQYAVGKAGTFRMNAPVKPGVKAGMAVSAFYTGPLKPSDSRNHPGGRRTVIVHGS